MGKIATCCYRGANVSILGMGASFIRKESPDCRRPLEGKAKADLKVNTFMRRATCGPKGTRKVVDWDEAPYILESSKIFKI